MFFDVMYNRNEETVIVLKCIKYLKLQTPLESTQISWSPLHRLSHCHPLCRIDRNNGKFAVALVIVERYNTTEKSQFIYFFGFRIHVYYVV